MLYALCKYPNTVWATASWEPIVMILGPAVTTELFTTQLHYVKEF